MLVILDVDYTLLDTHAFKQAMKDAVKELGVSEEVFQRTYDHVVHATPGQYNYDVEQHARSMAKVSATSESVIHTALIGVVDRTSEFLFPDVVPELQRLDSDGHTLIIFTWGNPNWQELKVERSGLMQYLDDVFCTADQKHKIELSFTIPRSEWIFVNDHPGEILELHKLYPEARLVRMKREGAAKRFSEEDERRYRMEVNIQEEIRSLRELVI